MSMNLPPKKTHNSGTCTVLIHDGGFGVLASCLAGGILYARLLMIIKVENKYQFSGLNEPPV